MPTSHDRRFSLDLFVDENIIGDLPVLLNNLPGVGAVLYPGHPDTPIKPASKDSQIFQIIGDDGYGPIFITSDQNVDSSSEGQWLRDMRIRAIIFPQQFEPRVCYELILAHWEEIVDIARHRGPSAHLLTEQGLDPVDLGDNF